MIRAYDEIYIDDAMHTLAEMFDYAATAEEADALFERFITSGVATQFERGNPHYLNMPPNALYYEVMGQYPQKVFWDAEKSRQYWCGFVLAYYQWYMGLRFEFIGKRFPPSRIIALYHPLHEVSLKDFIDIANNVVLQKETNLAKFRKTAKLSQRSLSQSSDVPLRSIQLYEQRRLDINYAPVNKLVRISKVLGCHIEDLMEPQIDWRSV